LPGRNRKFIQNKLISKGFHLDHYSIKFAPSKKAEVFKLKSEFTE